MSCSNFRALFNDRNKPASDQTSLACQTGSADPLLPAGCLGPGSGLEQSRGDLIEGASMTSSLCSQRASSQCSPECSVASGLGPPLPPPSSSLVQAHGFNCHLFAEDLHVSVATSLLGAPASMPSVTPPVALKHHTLCVQVGPIFSSPVCPLSK